jgi:hypothetical protein
LDIEMDESLLDRNQPTIPQDIPPLQTQWFANTQTAGCDQQTKRVHGLG